MPERRAEPVATPSSPQATPVRAVTNEATQLPTPTTNEVAQTKTNDLSTSSPPQPITVSKPEPQPPAVPSATEISALLHEMLSHFQSIVPAGYRLVIGPFTWEADKSSPFATYLTKELSAAIGTCGFLAECQRAELDKLLQEQKLSLSMLFDANKRPQLGQFVAAQGILTGSYWQQGDKTQIFVELADIQTARKLKTQKGELLQATPLVAVVPRDVSRVQKVLRDFSLNRPSDFALEVWVDRQKGGVYRIGETMRIHFRTMRDCYAKLYHVSADGKVQLIFPSDGQNHKLTAGQVYTIPEAGSNLAAMDVTEPAGSEIIKAVASTLEFVEIETPGKVLGEIDEQGVVRAGALDLRGLSLEGAHAEDVCVYTVSE